MIDAYIEASWHTCISLHTVTNSHITRCFQSKGLDNNQNLYNEVDHSIFWPIGELYCKVSTIQHKCGVPEI